MFDLAATWDAIDALDNQVPAQVQILMQLETKRLGERATRWLLRNQPLPLQISAAVDRHRPRIHELRSVLVGLLRGSDQRAWQRTLDLVSEEGVPPDLAETVAGLGLIITALDITEVQERAGTSIEQTAGAYFALDDELALGWMRERIIALPRDDRWASLARSALRDDFFRAHAELTESVVSSGPAGADADTLVREWLVGRRLHVDHCLSVLADIRATGRSDLAQLSVGLRELRNLIHVAGRGGAPPSRESRPAG
jgi:glutamate dehydrogenase